MTRVRVRAAREHVAVRAVGGAEDVAVLHRLADADLGRLLADRDVQEAGQLAGAEPLLDLLLEAPDEQHLAQELAQPLLGQRPPLLDLGHLRRECTFRAMRLVRQWHELEARLPDGWVDAQARLPRCDDRATATARRRCSAPLQATRSSDASLRSASRATAAGRRPRWPSALLDRVGLEKIAGTIDCVVGVRRAAPAARRRRAPAAERAAGVVGRRAGDAAGRLERPARRDRARRRRDYLERAALCLSPINPRRDGERARAPLPLRAQARLRRVARDGAPLPRALRRDRACAARSACCARCRDTQPVADAGAGLADRRDGRFDARIPSAGSSSSPAGRSSTATATRRARSPRCSATRARHLRRPRPRPGRVQRAALPGVGARDQHRRGLRPGRPDDAGARPARSVRGVAWPTAAAVKRGGPASRLRRTMFGRNA